MKLQVLFGILVVCRLEEGEILSFIVARRCSVVQLAGLRAIKIWLFNASFLSLDFSLSIYIYFNERMAEKSHGRINNTLSISFVDTGKKIHLL